MNFPRWFRSLAVALLVAAPIPVFAKTYPGALIHSNQKASIPEIATPRAIYGKLSPPTGDISEAAARRFLAQQAGLFKSGSAMDDLRLSREFESPMGRHFVFEQVYRGIPVHGGQAAVHFNNEGVVVGMTNRLHPVTYVDIMPRFRLGKGHPNANLVIRIIDQVPHLAWRVVVPTEAETWESFVDAHSGALLDSPTDINRYVNGTGQVFIVNAVVATRDNSLVDDNDSATAVPSSAYTLVSLQGLSGNGLLDGEFASSSAGKKRVSSASHTFIFDRSKDGFSETMGYYSFDHAQRYIQSLGFTNVNNRQQVFSVNRFKRDNSFYSLNSKEITLGLGGVDDAEDADVIWHEYGHSIQDNQVPDFGSSLEGGSMGEGFGDYWAGTIGAQFSGGFQDTCIAEWDATSYSSTVPPCLRRLDSTKHYPEDVVGQVHADGEIWSAALWQIRAAIGAVKTDKAVLQSHFLLAPDATFNEGANALVTAAINLGYSTREVNEIRRILRARGFTVTA